MQTETKRYDVGPEQGYRTPTTLKLTDQQAKELGLTSKNLSKVTTTADDAAHARTYEEALTRQDEMRAAEVERANEADAERQKAEADAGNKKRGSTAKKPDGE